MTAAFDDLIAEYMTVYMDLSGMLLFVLKPRHGLSAGYDGLDPDLREEKRRTKRSTGSG